MSFEVNVVKEIHPGVFWMLLEFPTSRLLEEILDDSYQYVWCHNHIVGNYSWAQYRLPLFRDNVAYDVTSRIMSFDFLMPTENFKAALPKCAPGIHVIQLNKMPPDYFDLDKIKGQARYELLADCEWLFEFDVPGNDNGQIASPNKQLLLALQQNASVSHGDLC